MRTALRASGHEVTLASKNLEHAKEAAGRAGGGVRIVPLAEVTRDTEMIIAAASYDQQADGLRLTGQVSGKTVIEVSNPLKAIVGGHRAVGSIPVADPVCQDTPTQKQSSLDEDAAILQLPGPAVLIGALASDTLALRRELEAGWPY